MMIVFIAFSPLQLTLTRFFSEYIAKKKFSILYSVFKKIIKRIFFFSILLLVVFILFKSFIASFFKINSLYILIIGLVITFSLFSPPFFSFIQSLQKFKLLSFLSIISSSVKLILGTVLMFLGWKVVGGLLGLLGSSLVILIVFLIMFGKIFKKEELPVKLLPIYKYFLPVSLAMISFTILTNIDIILVKHFFSPQEAGYYSIAQMIGKVVLFLPSALAIVIFPKSTQAYVKNEHSFSYLYKSLTIAGICGGVVSILCFLFPDFVLEIITGKANPVSRKLVSMFSLAMAFYSLVWITINFLLAVNNLKFVKYLVCVALLESCFIYFFHFTLEVILKILLFFSILSFLITLYTGELIKPPVTRKI